MSQPTYPNPPPLSGKDAFFELLTDTLKTLESPARGQFLRMFFRTIAHVDLTEIQSIDLWERALVRRSELSESIDKNTTLQAALVTVLASSNLMRLPILMEYEELQKLRINVATDPLTGLYNRRFFDEYFEKEINRSNRYSLPLALVVFDLYHFKEVNDHFGHLQGDILLQMVATTLRKSLRTSDYAFRTGGDEFAVLLPQSDMEQTATLSRRLRAAYAAAIEPLHLDSPLALDYGLAVYPVDGKQQELLMRVADERLYQLKEKTCGSSTAPATAATVQPETKEKQGAARPTISAGQVSSSQERKTLGSERRKWERISLANARAYALIGEGVDFIARVVDLSYGGLAFETRRPAELNDAFDALLHVPVLPPARVSLRRIYQMPGSTGTSRIGCSYVTQAIGTQ